MLWNVGLVLHWEPILKEKMPSITCSPLQQWHLEEGDVEKAGGSLGRGGTAASMMTDISLSARV